MKKMCGVMMLAVMLFALTGCRMYADYVVNGNGTVTSSGVIAYTEEELEMMDAEIDEQATLKTLEDGKQYYVVEQEPQTKSIEKVKEENGILITEDIFFFETGEYDDTVGGATAGEQLSQEALYLQLSVALRGEIVSTNGQISEDGTKVVFNTKDNAKDACWYAYTQSGKDLIAADTKAPKMKGAKNNKYYKKMPTNIQFTDDIAVKNVKLNGQFVRTISTTSVANGKTKVETKWVNGSAQDVSKNGKNVFKVTDLNGNTSTFIIYIDNKTPVVKGVKNNKTYKKKAVIYVKDAVMIKTIKINGKAQKMGNKQLVKNGKYKGYYRYTLKKKGTNKIVVTDMAGNKKTVNIKIKK